MLCLWALSHRGRVSVCAAPERILRGIKRFKCLLAWLSYATGSMSAGRKHLRAHLGATLLGENYGRAGVLHFLGEKYGRAGVLRLPRPHMKHKRVHAAVP